MILYAVMVTHSTGHGLASNVILVTPHIPVAANVLGKVDELGYELHGSKDETNVVVFALKDGQTYPKTAFELVGSEAAPPQFPTVLWRWKGGGRWHTKWSNETQREGWLPYMPD